MRQEDALSPCVQSQPASVGEGVRCPLCQFVCWFAESQRRGGGTVGPDRSSSDGLARGPVLPTPPAARPGDRASESQAHPEEAAGTLVPEFCFIFKEWPGIELVTLWSRGHCSVH